MMFFFNTEPAWQHRSVPPQKPVTMRLKRAPAALGAPHGDSARFQRLCTRVPTVERLLTSDLELLARECGYEHTELKRLATDIALDSTQPVHTARQRVTAHRAQGPLLSTGVPSLDLLLKGGVRAGEVCELVGAPGSGKTACCLAACAAQAVTQHGVLILDTTNGFRAVRLLEALRQRRVPKQLRSEFLGTRCRVSAAPQARTLPVCVRCT